MQVRAQFNLAKRADVSVSSIRKIFAQIPELAKKRLDEGLPPLIDLSIGQPHFPPHPEVMAALRELELAPGSLGYSSAQGEAETLEAIVKLYHHYYPRAQYKKEEVMVTVGASGALSNIFSILVDKDDVILAFEPYFGAYIGQVQEWGGSLKKIPTLNQNFRPTAEALEEAIKAYPQTKAVILNYPNKPSGVALTRNELEELAKIFEAYPDLLIIIDDVYRDFNYREHLTLLDIMPEFKDRCIVINSGAKGLLGAPGERIGMIGAHKELIKCMLPRQTNGMSSVPCRTQAALRLAVSSYLKDTNNLWLINAKQEYKNNVECAFDTFKDSGFMIAQIPEGAFYLLINAKHLIGRKLPDRNQLLKNDLDIADYFLHQTGVALVPGSGFGIDPDQGYLRISCAKSKELILEAAQRLGIASKLLLAPSHLDRFSLLAVSQEKESVITQSMVPTQSISNA